MIERSPDVLITLDVRSPARLLAGTSFNGRTPASGAGYWGSNPYVPANSPIFAKILSIYDRSNPKTSVSVIFECHFENLRDTRRAILRNWQYERFSVEALRRGRGVIESNGVPTPFAATVSAVGNVETCRQLQAAGGQTDTDPPSTKPRPCATSGAQWPAARLVGDRRARSSPLGCSRVESSVRRRSRPSPGRCGRRSAAAIGSGS